MTDRIDELMKDIEIYVRTGSFGNARHTLEKIITEVKNK